MKRNAVRDTLRVLKWAKPYVALVILTLLVLSLSTFIIQSRGVLAGLFAHVLKQPEAKEYDGHRILIEMTARENQGISEFDLSPEPEEEKGFDALQVLASYVSPPHEDARSLGPLLRLAMLAVGLGVCIAVFSFLADWLSKYLINRVAVDMRCSVCEHLIALPLSFFDEKHQGELYARLTNDLNLSRQAIDILLSDIIRQPLTLFWAVAIAFLISWQMSIAVFLIIPLPVWLLVKIGGKVKKKGRRRQVKVGHLTHMMVQFLSGIRIVKAFSMEQDEIRQFREESNNFVHRAMHVVRYKALSNALFRLIGNLGLGIVLVMGGWVLLHGWFDLEPKHLYWYLANLALMYTPGRVLIKAYNKLQDSLSGTERVLELLETKPEIIDDPNAIDLPHVQHGIVFRNVTFSYNHEPVLKNIDLDVQAGETVAIVGRSGAGKSTLVDLIPRFYDPNDGSIEIDGTDLRRISRRSLLDQIAIVSQDPFLFDASIADNIRYGSRNASDEEITAAAIAANIHDFIQTLPDKYDTVVGERGAKLSGGQRQRITIARAIIKDAPILILDEATSSLDTESEALIQEALENLMVGRTTFVIAHRLSTVEHAQKIIVLRNGEIVETGTHTSLLEQDGEYCRLYRMDFRSGSKNGQNSG